MSSIHKVVFTTLFIILVIDLSFLNRAEAEPYPNKPIKMVIPYAAGGTGDVMGRVIGIELSEILKTPVITELHPGAGGNLGAELVAKSDPNGYTILFASISLATSVSLSKLNFDPTKDLTPIAGGFTMPSILLISEKLPYKYLRDLVIASKARSVDISYASSGINTGSHLLGTLFANEAQINLLHIPYKGTGAAYPDLISGRVTIMFDIAGSAVGHLSDGSLRPLGITSLKRAPSLPNIPTIAEQGYPDFQFGIWFGFFAPKGTPPEIVHRLESAILKALETEVVRSRLKDANAGKIPRKTEEFKKWYLKDVAKWRNLVQAGILKPDE
ncbi:Bug family tripartite tricarboxylate transporter substrate binding protein [Polynucleobacter asymbioticus]|jgi:tripartite-type tricarboxylate transporter receptor subunit TctC|uniref:Tripartite tricarboxylate transporter substrate binding protein n=1 Tax=Polynucleobacter asymbioticus TaxID=576611 RepID=A0AAC9ITG3_9BURK|nr:tripartite tricarboxylate transporter substrate binding protein [Polynucleobacter asymbioticus]APB98215.1 hypothetical protein A4F89_02110 [Polynucleobacter asymbioticus]APC00501.1 hypothetical protein AOC25_02115 [Polynucleobacter asymbioticus]